MHQPYSFPIPLSLLLHLFYKPLSSFDNLLILYFMIRILKEKKLLVLLPLYNMLILCDEFTILVLVLVWLKNPDIFGIFGINVKVASGVWCLVSGIGRNDWYEYQARYWNLVYVSVQILGISIGLGIDLNKGIVIVICIRVSVEHYKNIR